MAEPSRITDAPNFDTYPVTASSPGENFPAGTRVEELLIDTAESVGAALGSAVRRVTELQQLLEKQFNSIQERTRAAAAAKVTDIKDAADARVQGLKDATGEQIQRARAQAEYVAREYPLQVIAGVAVGAFLAGVSLRIWRANRG